MLCKKCETKTPDDEKLCSNCSEKIDQNKENTNNTTKTITISLNKFIVITVILAFIIITLLCFFTFRNDTPFSEFKSILEDEKITDEYLTDNFKKNGFDIYDSVYVKILTTEDINYNDFNKLVMAKLYIQSNNQSSQTTSLLLVNRKKDIVNSFEVSKNLICLFDGASSECASKIPEITKICAQYIQKNGTDFLNDSESVEFKNLIQEITNLIGIEQSREIIINEYYKYTSNLNMEYTLLFDKDSALVKYMAFSETVFKFNSSYPIDERTYNYLANGNYTNRQTLNTMEYVYGSPYILATQYSVYSVKQNSELVGTYSSLEDIITDLDIEVLGKHLENTSNINDTDNNLIINSNETNINQQTDPFSEDDIYEDDTINIRGINDKKLNFNQIKQELESKGLEVKCFEHTEIVTYLNENANTEQCVIYDDIGPYKKGDTVTVNVIKYEARPIDATFKIEFVNISWRDDMYCMLDKETREQGLQVYFDDTLVATVHADESKCFKYEFTHEEQVRVKLVAPYVSYIDNKIELEKLPIVENITVSDYTLYIKDISSYQAYDLYVKLN